MVVCVRNREGSGEGGGGGGGVKGQDHYPHCLCLVSGNEVLIKKIPTSTKKKYKEISTMVV